MVEPELISRKLSRLEEYVSELRRADDVTWELYRKDVRTRAFVERYLHMAIETVLDIGNHMISYHRWREPESYRDIFNVLNEQGVIPSEHLADFQNMAGFRNILVHSYDRIDDEAVFVIFKKRLKDFDLFSNLIKVWLRGLETRQT